MTPIEIQERHVSEAYNDYLNSSSRMGEVYYERYEREEERLRLMRNAEKVVTQAQIKEIFE